MRSGSMLAVYNWRQNWNCYLAMGMSDIALVQSALLFTLIAMKRCLAVVRPLQVYLLGFRQLKSIIFWIWVLSGVIACVVFGISLLTHVSQQNLPQTGVFCLLFTHVQDYWPIAVIIYVLYTVLFIFVMLVMFIDAVLIIHGKQKAKNELRKSKYSTKTQRLKLMARLFLEVGCVFGAFVPTVVGFICHLDMNVDSLEFFTTEVAVFAGIFRTLVVCIFHTFLAADFKKSLLAYFS